MSAPTDVVKKAISDFGTILQDVVASRISLTQAIDRATVPGIAGMLPVEVLGKDAEVIADASFRDWRGAAKGIRIVMAVMEARPPEDRLLPLRVSVTLAQIEVATRACADVPDGRLFQPAVAAGESIVRETEAAGDKDTPGWVLQSLGVLHLDPWLLGGQVDNYDLGMNRWKARLLEEYGMHLAGVALEELALPNPPDALAAAQSYFRRALAYRTGLDRVGTLKALVQASLLAERLGATVDRAELSAFVEEALGLFKERENPALYADLLGFLTSLGMALPEGETEGASQELLDESLEETVRRLGFPATMLRYQARIVREQSRHSPVALQLWQKASYLVRAMSSPVARADHLDLGLKLILTLYGNIDFDPTEAHFLLEKANEILADLNAGKVSRDRAAGALVALASIAPNSDSESAGLGILDAARKVAPEWMERIDEPVRFLDAKLHEGLAVNAYRANRYGDGVAQYIFAARRFSDLELSSAAIGDLRKADDLIRRGDDDVVNNAIGSLASSVTMIQSGTGRAGIEALRTIFNTVLTKVVATGAMNETVATYLWGIVKGVAFSSALRAPSPWRWDRDERAAELLHQVAAAEAAAALSPESPAGDRAIDENGLLSAYTAPDELSSGSDARAILENTQHVFDAFVSARVLDGAAKQQPGLMSSDDLKAALGDRTVLVNPLLGPSPDGMSALYTMIATRERITIAYGVLGLPSATIILEDKDGKRIEADYFTLPVGELRRQVIANDNPEERLASDMGTHLGGGLKEQLDKLRSEGKDHLCYVPHGPMHYYPFHLLGTAGSPLAAEWKVSYLPSMSMLASRAELAPASAVTTEFRAFGVDWEAGNPAGLPVLSNASTEAQAVAGNFGITAEVNEKATKAALLDALTSARMVHVATHGLYNVAGPAFQSICMKPDGGDDGVVKAYELIGLDLRGCELITLSACETALGRFDRLGNIRGLPATLFIAGAQTIIGTLWDAETHCAQYFFSMLYERLRAGDSKLDAFRNAQTAAREYYPEYRDWGAFYYAGRW